MKDGVSQRRKSPSDVTQRLLSPRRFAAPDCNEWIKPMAKAELGEKRRCLSCSAAFFDLNRSPIVCPKCAAVFQVVEIVRSSSASSRMRTAAFRRGAPTLPVQVDEIMSVEEKPASEVETTEQDDEAQEAEVAS
jgi:uncharacterized protein (TIGR02300 family)